MPRHCSICGKIIPPSIEEHRCEACGCDLCWKDVVRKKGHKYCPYCAKLH